MQSGRFVEQGLSEAVLQHPQHEYTRSSLEVVPSIAVAA